MREPDAPSGVGAGGNVNLISAVRGVIEQFGSANAQALAEIVSLYLDHPLWAVWLPTESREWVAVRPAGSRPPAPEAPMVWVTAETPVELGKRMRVADAGLAPPGYGC
jgi:hypothetical protein